MTIIAIDQTSRTSPIPTIKHGDFEIRYAFYPKLELFQDGDRGEDYLVFRVEGNRFAFALCDGVGGSYFGGVAAQTVGEVLLDTLWKAAGAKTLTQSALNKKLLNALNASQSKHIASAELRRKTEQLSPNLRKHLGGFQEQIGSQSNFVCGLVDLDAPSSSKPIWLFWLGDARLKVYRREQLQGPELTGASRQAWSSELGVVGEIETAVFGLDQIDQVIAYSDGLDPAAALLDRRITDEDLTRAINDSQQEKDDDVSFLEIRFQDGNYQPLDELAPQIRTLLNPAVQAKPKVDQPPQRGEHDELGEAGPETVADEKSRVLQWFLGGVALVLALGLGLILGGMPAVQSVTQGNSHRTAVAQTSSAMIENVVATLSTLSTAQEQNLQSTMQSQVELAVQATLTALFPESGETEIHTQTPTSTPVVSPTLEVEGTSTSGSED